MLQITVVGNLGADAKVQESNGKKFVSFNVGHNEKWSDQNGTEHVSTQWVSCVINNDGGNLIHYLKKGKTVFVIGRGSTRVYSSEKERRMVAGLNVSVDRIELIGGSNDDIPRELVDTDGCLHKVYKAYFIGKEDCNTLGVDENNTAVLRSKDMQSEYMILNGGWITKKPCGDTNTTEN